MLVQTLYYKLSACYKKIGALSNDKTSGPRKNFYGKLICMYYLLTDKLKYKCIYYALRRTCVFFLVLVV